MNKFKFLFLITLAMLPFAGLFSQQGNWCGTPYYDSIEISRDSGIIARRAALEKFTSDFTESDSKTVLTIPVVFHIVHDYGAENIPKSSIEAVMEQMNKDYRKQNMELSQVVAQFKPIIADVEVEFKLARIDPNGNCTEGITRTYSLATYNADNNVKYVVPGWNPNKYLNIWVVNSIGSGAAAWSHYPGVDPALDGVVCKYNYIGYNHVITHEVGHYLNLMHTWGDSNEPGVSSNCYMDDNVSDTPNTIGTVNNDCNLSQTTCGSLDNVQNYMDYSSCYIMFTEGQKSRMRAALNSWIGGRNNLWTNANLIATGTNAGYVSPACAPIADFNADNKTGCQAMTVHYSDLSYNGEVTAYEWFFDGGNPSYSTLPDPVVVYQQPGKFNVTLTVYNSAGSNTKTKQAFIHVTDTLAGVMAPMLQDMQSPVFPDYASQPDLKWTIQGNSVYNFTKYTHSNGNISMRVNNYGNYEGTVSELISPNIYYSNSVDMSQLEFKLAYARKSTSSSDVLKVFISTNCGQTWLMRYIKMGSSLVTNGGTIVTGNFIPTDSEWKQVKINTNITQPVNHLMIKFQVTSNNGNYLYIDDIKIGQPTLVEKPFGSHKNLNLTVNPNPFHNEADISFELDKNEKIKFSLTDMTGSVFKIAEYSGVAGENAIKTSGLFNQLNPGLYLLKIDSGNAYETVKIAVY